MLFPHYNKTKVVYHVVNINQLKNILEQGIQIQERKDFSDDKYLDFNQFLDKNKPAWIPKWISRKNALFASLNFKENMQWHSHSALLALKVQEERCWVANENLANEIYDPFILQYIDQFNSARDFMKNYGRQKALYYWNNSFPFQEYLKKGKTPMKNYDEEVMIFHNIVPENIKCLMVVTDHYIFTPQEWQKYYEQYF
ncbi:hypothetical protein [Garciella nitratireducens]|uniref:hypothetical protein n=1 Tax=Garciella nitratireducens TaxID=218205 RepID=UPI000DE8E3B6|nr:hypothetical protein [Garciella nitratireducens]RBP37247.1 hypothetical protein DFR81_1257 [Garciella nitratireducens]